MIPGNPWLPGTPVSYAQPEIKLEIRIDATGLSPLLPALPTLAVIEFRMAIRDQGGRGEALVGALAQGEGLEPGVGLTPPVEKAMHEVADELVRRYSAVAAVPRREWIRP